MLKSFLYISSVSNLPHFSFFQLCLILAPCTLWRAWLHRLDNLLVRIGSPIAFHPQNKQKPKEEHKNNSSAVTVVHRWELSVLSLQYRHCWWFPSTLVILSQHLATEGRGPVQVQLLCSVIALFPELSAIWDSQPHHYAV